jgi:hypothetical protein
VDYWKALCELHEERQRINALIASLEAQKRGKNPAAEPPRRGRKGMPPEERKVVSDRMRAYWSRRKDDGPGSRGASR